MTHEDGVIQTPGHCQRLWGVGLSLVHGARLAPVSPAPSAAAAREDEADKACNAT